MEQNDGMMDDEDKARNLFLKGIDMEKIGNHYEAINYYKKAIQLVPDIEFKMVYTTTTTTQSIQSEDDETDEDDEENDTDDEEILIKIQKKMWKTNYFCQPDNTTQKFNKHISELPSELIEYIIKWVVSTELDLRSLEKLGETCRGFYLYSRKEEIWKLSCFKVWGYNNSINNLINYNNNWRQMYINKLRLKYDGCYISKTSYIRRGENSFQDQFYRPFHFVQYYRYFRFFPDGTVLMLISSDEPINCVSLLKNKKIKSIQSQVLTGNYNLIDNDKIIINIKKIDEIFEINKKNRKKERIKLNERLYNIEFKLSNYKNKKNCQLQWINYKVINKGDDNVFDFGTDINQFKSCWFSRVKSYTNDAGRPLI